MESINSLIGAITRGEDGSGVVCDILVEWVNEACDLTIAVRGRVIQDGKLTRRKAVHLARRGFEKIESGDPEYLHLAAPGSIVGRLRALEQGQSVEVSGENLRVWRNAASRLKIEEGLTLTVSRTPHGLRAARVE